MAQKYKPLLLEFARYGLVGGAAFLLDAGVLFLSKGLFFDPLGNIGILFATGCGFAAGLAFNYVLSLRFVFRNAGNPAKARTPQAFLRFLAIGLVGLAITEAGMYAGTLRWGAANDGILLVLKTVLALVVFLWNYIGRKIFVFESYTAK